MADPGWPAFRTVQPSFRAALIDRRQPSQVFLAGGAVLCLVGALVLVLQPQPELLHVHRGMAAAALLAALVFAWFSRSSAPLGVESRVLVAALLGITLVSVLAWQLGTGLRTIVLGILPLLVGLSTLLCGPGRAALVVGAAVAAVSALAWRDHAMGRQAIIGALAPLTEMSALSAHIVLLLGGLVCGLVGRGLVQRWRSVAEDRERQFRELLASAADRYIELDAELKFAAPTVDIPMAGGPIPAHFLGRHPWDAPGLQFAPGQAEANRADLLARRPFQLQLVSAPDPARPPEHLLVSGRPRYSGSGEFLGYWCAGRDITAQEQRRRDAEQAAADALAASRAKSAFLANMSHEIRTPLNGMLGLAQLARTHVDDRARLVEYLDLIGTSASALHATLSNVLDLSRLEAGRMELASEPFELQALLQELHRSFSALAQARGLGCALSVHPGVPDRVRGDAARLRQVLTNYLHNALKFTERGGIALHAVPADDGRVRFEVHDTGPGLGDAEQARLFEAFSQTDPSSARAQRGSGLGLSICRELSQAMGGQVGVVSSPGQGSRFWAELPLPEAPQSPAQRVGAAASPQEGGAPSIAGLRVLVVEDNPVNMMISVALLEDMGAEVTQAVDGRVAIDAVAAAGDRPFDVVLMDLQMPELDGIDAVRAIRAMKVTTPIIALTAALLDEEPLELKQAGFDATLGKPVEASRLQQVLAHWASARRL